MPQNRSRKLKLLYIASAMTALTSVASQDRGFVPKEGYIPDAKTAVAVAEAILVPIYGQKQIESEKPFDAKLDDKGVWTVEGSLPHDMVGGVATLRMQRKDGRIVYGMHGK